MEAFGYGGSFTRYKIDKPTSIPARSRVMKTRRTIILPILALLFSFGLGVRSSLASEPQPLDRSYTIESFAAGDGPQYLTFDGANVWVTNYYANTVTKLRASDGERLGDFDAGRSPKYLTFDGENIWVADENGRSLTKLRASDGTFLLTIPTLFDAPEGIAWDGTNIWVAVSSLGAVERIRGSDSKRDLIVSIGGFPQGVIFDGTYIWVADWGGTTVHKIQTDGTVVGNFFAGSRPLNLVSDGRNIWAGNDTSFAGYTVTILRASDGMLKGVFQGKAVPESLAFDGSNIWITNQDVDSVTVLRARDSSKARDINVGDGPEGILFDGTSIWVACSNSDTVNKITRSAH